jgi:uncharacterized membrane-anchored protein YhcB (DUF1043 family)
MFILCFLVGFIVGCLTLMAVEKLTERNYKKSEVHKKLEESNEEAERVCKELQKVAKWFDTINKTIESGNLVIIGKK